MESIFHEKQEGYLCAQHCLNALLQEPLFNAVHLANLAEQLDQEERLAMAESGEDTDDYKRFIEQPSGNMDDSGFFSVQVISRALKFWNLELVPYTSTTETEALIAQDDPSYVITLQDVFGKYKMTAYICNYKGHWFTIRKIGNQWFNLNSMLSGPQLVSNTYLAMYLAQLIQEGYSIFIVRGSLPQCRADEILLNNPVVIKPSANVNANDGASTSGAGEPSKFPSKGYRLGSKAEDEAKILEAARAFENVTVPSTSRVNTRPDVEIISELPRQPRERIIPIKVEGRDEVHTVVDGREEVHTVVDDEDEELQKAVQLSLENYEMEQRDRNLKLRLEDPPAATFAAPASVEEEEDDELRRALQLSLECVTAPPTPDREDIRWHRLNYLRMHSNQTQSENSAKLNT